MAIVLEQFKQLLFYNRGFLRSGEKVFLLAPPELILSWDSMLSGVNGAYHAAFIGYKDKIAGYWLNWEYVKNIAGAGANVFQVNTGSHNRCN